MKARSLEGGLGLRLGDRYIRLLAGMHSVTGRHVNAKGRQVFVRIVVCLLKRVT